MSARPSWWKRLFASSRGRGAGATPGAGADLAELGRRVAALQLDVRDRDERIEAMTRDYELLQATTHQAAGRAGDVELEKVFKRLVGGLSNLSALATLASRGQQVEVRDMADLVVALEKDLGRYGLERISVAGDRTTFDVAVHQRMSGGTVRDGTPVTVHLPGYRFGGKVLLKAMVSAREAG